MTGFFQDVRYALRSMAKNRAFTATVVITLALGIGANTAVFSVMNAVLLRMLPVREPERLYHVRIANGQGQPPAASNTGDSETSFSEPVFEALRERHDIFEDLMAYAPLNIGKTAVRYQETPEEALGSEVSGNFFSGLGASIPLGRGFSIDEEKNHSSVVVISYQYWTRRFARDPQIVGKTLFVKNIPFTIVGITGSDFRGVLPGISSDLWIPLQNRPELNAWGMPGSGQTLYGSPRWWSLLLVARLKSGITPQSAQNALQSTFGEAAKIGVGTIDPEKWKPLLDFEPAKGIRGYNQQYREPVEILMGLVALVLLIACTNVAMLVVARNEARRREFSLRMAIGAERFHLFRQLLTESSLLVTAGAALGWLFANLATVALADWSGIETGLDPDRKVLAFTLAISALSALAFGLVPLWIAMHSPLAGTLRVSTANLSQSRRRAFGGRVLMSLQVAICLLLLLAAGLLLRSLRNYQKQDLGMKTDGLLVFGITPQSARTGAETYNFYRTLLDRIRTLPGVTGATFMDNRVGTGWSNNNDDGLDGSSLTAKFGANAIVRSNNVGPNYFQVMGTPVLQGRDISDSDTPSSAPVAIVNETFVKRFLSGINPLGHKVRNCTIVGVVRDSKYTSVDEAPMPMAYYPSFQGMGAGATFHFEVRALGDPLSFLPAIREVVHEIDPNAPLEKPLTQRSQFEESYAQPKMFARLGAFFGVLAALLVATGLYGTLSYRTNRRTAEIGTRMALGAQRKQVLWMIMRESLMICLAGVALGFPLALASVRILANLLYQLSPFDSVAFVTATSVVAMVAAVAAFIPARRAAKVEPMVALRYE